MNRHATVQAVDLSGASEQFITMRTEETIRNRRFPSRTLWAGAIVIVVTINLINAAFLLANADIPSAAYPLISVRPQYNLAALVVAGVELLAGLAALHQAYRLKQERAPAPRTLSWAAAGIALIGLGVADLTHVQSEVTLPVAVSVVLGIAVVITGTLTCAWVSRDVWPDRLARWCWITGIVLLLTNPATESWKLSLSSDPGNYEFVTNTQPWRFSRAAWRELHSLELLQETTEDIAAFCLLYAILRTSTPNRRSTSAEIERPLERS